MCFMQARLRGRITSTTRTDGFHPLGVLVRRRLLPRRHEDRDGHGTIKPIESIAAGDVIPAYDEASGKMKPDT
jgi:hypothetical protein